MPSFKPSANPTFSSQVNAVFQSTLSLLGVNCSAIDGSSPAKLSIRQTVALTLGIPVNQVVYVLCSSNRRRLSETSSRFLLANNRANVTTSITLVTNDPASAVAAATKNLTVSSSSGALTNTLQQVSVQNGAVATQSVVVYAVANGNSQIVSSSPSTAPTDAPSAKPIEATASPTVAVTQEELLQ